MSLHGLRLRVKLEKLELEFGVMSNGECASSLVEMVGEILDCDGFGEYTEHYKSAKRSYAYINIEFLAKPDYEDTTFNDGRDICIGDLELIKLSDSEITATIRIKLPESSLQHFTLLKDYNLIVSPCFLTEGDTAKKCQYIDDAGNLRSFVRFINLDPVLEEQNA